METGVSGSLVAMAKTEPVKNAFRLGWEFFLQNKMLCLIAIGAFFVLELLAMIPVLGLIASVAVGVYGQSIQIYTGKLFYRADSMEAFVEAVRQTKFDAFAMRNAKPAFGAWLGWFLVGMLIVLLFFVMLMAFGVSAEQLSHGANNEAQMAELMMSLGGAMLPALLVVLILAYIFPIVQGRVILSETFGEAFSAVMSLFSPAVWTSAMQGEYFRFVLFFGLVLIGLSVVAGIAMGILMLIPVLGWIVVFAALIFAMFQLMLILSFANVLAKEIAQPVQAD